MAGMTQGSPGRQATSLFTDRFGSGPTVLVSAPGRVNLIGEHLDYNGGPVLPLALERRTVVAAGHAPSWRAVSSLDGEVRAVDPLRLEPGQWHGYLVGVIRAAARAGITLKGAELAVASTVPSGAGLSSSAALTVACARALAGLAGQKVPPEALIDIAWVAEHDEVGVACGRMDQTIAALARPGHALLFETASGAVTHLPFPEKIWVLETGVSHRLTGGQLNARRQESEVTLRLVREQGLRVEHLAEVPSSELPRLLRAIPVPWQLRLRHVVTETERTRQAAQALLAGDWTQLGALLLAGHESLRQDYQSSCAEADLLVEQAMGHGALGARLTGAGWGGAVLALLPAVREARIVAEVQEAFRRAYGRVPQVWSTRAGGGVRSEK
jgi:galactokinase